MDLWVEKHRPQTLADVVGNEPIVTRFKRLAEQGHIPHMLLAGPPGTGKTTSIICLIRDMLIARPNLFDRIVLELNASDDRGIDVIRDRVQNFAKEKISLPPGIHKFVILDEADSMTEAAQQALRHLMEAYSESTRFALACNLSSKIIEPIQSRCAIARFTSLTEQQICQRLLNICQIENVQFTADGIQALSHIASGDLRNAINNLQGTAVGFELVDKQNVYKICSVPPPETVLKLIEYCSQGKWYQGKQLAMDLLANAYSVTDIFSALRTAIKNAKVPESLLLEYIKIISQAHLTATTGLDTTTQLHRTVALMCKAALTLTN